MIKCNTIAVVKVKSESAVEPSHNSRQGSGHSPSVAVTAKRELALSTEEKRLQHRSEVKGHIYTCERKNLPVSESRKIYPPPRFFPQNNDHVMCAAHKKEYGLAVSH